MAGAYIRIEPLTSENYDTWKLKMRAVLVKSDLWQYVDGAKPCPEDPSLVAEWKSHDEKARADILLAISTSELSVIDNCLTARGSWMKLQETFQSKGPVRKANLLKRVALSRMSEGGDARHHIGSFFDAVKRLKEIGVHIGNDLLAILLLYSLPDSYETFRCAMETRDDLPDPEVLRIKILEESEARQAKNERSDQNALYANNGKGRDRNEKMQKETRKCYVCDKAGNLARNC